MMSQYKRQLHGLLILAPLTFLAFATAQDQHSVQEIMAKVAANQDRSQEMRSAYVYHQDLLLRFKRGNGKTAREEEREYNVTPTPAGTEKQLTRFAGRYEKGGKMIEYSEPGFKYKDMDIDGDVIENLADDLANDKESRDGISKDLFPLTTREQKKYLFSLRGRENHLGKEVYRITFKPNRHETSDEDGTPWEGVILVDTHDYQPIMVTTSLARSVPVAVRTLLGTDLKGLGFKVTYDKFDEGLWFPVSYGSEFEVKALFLYKRKIAVSLRNNGFQRAQVAARITYDETLHIQKSMKVQETKTPANPPPHP